MAPSPSPLSLWLLAMVGTVSAASRHWQVIDLLSVRSALEEAAALEKLAAGMASTDSLSLASTFSLPRGASALLLGVYGQSNRSPYLEVSLVGTSSEVVLRYLMEDGTTGSVTLRQAELADGLPHSVVLRLEGLRRGGPMVAELYIDCRWVDASQRLPVMAAIPGGKAQNVYSKTSEAFSQSQGSLEELKLILGGSIAQIAALLDCPLQDDNRLRTTAAAIDFMALGNAAQEAAAVGKLATEIRVVDELFLASTFHLPPAQGGILLGFYRNGDNARYLEFSVMGKINRVLLRYLREDGKTQSVMLNNARLADGKPHAVILRVSGLRRGRLEAELYVDCQRVDSSQGLPAMVAIPAQASHSVHTRISKVFGREPDSLVELKLIAGGSLTHVGSPRGCLLHGDDTLKNTVNDANSILGDQIKALVGQLVLFNQGLRELRQDIREQVKEMSLMRNTVLECQICGEYVFPAPESPRLSDLWLRDTARKQALRPTESAPTSDPRTILRAHTHTLGTGQFYAYTHTNSPANPHVFGAWGGGGKSKISEKPHGENVQTPCGQTAPEVGVEPGSPALQAT